MLSYVYHFLHALTFSVIVESAFVLALCFLLKKDKRIALLAGFGTMLTIPYVWFVFPTLLWYSSSLAILSAEGFAFVGEALIYKYVGKLSWKYALVFSLLANAASYFLGKLV